MGGVEGGVLPGEEEEDEEEEEEEAESRRSRFA